MRLLRLLILLYAFTHASAAASPSALAQTTRHPVVLAPSVHFGKLDYVRDGDTIVVAGKPIRLNGVDAPEMRDPFGQASRQAMIGLTQGQWLTCLMDGTRTHDRYVGVCIRNDGVDVGRALIMQGLALDCAKFSKGRYRQYEPTDVRNKLKQAPYCEEKLRQ